MQGFVDGYKATMTEKVTDSMDQQDPPTRHVTLFYKKLLNNNENNDNTNEKNSELRIFIQNHSDGHYFTRHKTQHLVCNDVFEHASWMLLPLLSFVLECTRVFFVSFFFRNTNMLQHRNVICTATPKQSISLPSKRLDIRCFYFFHQ